MLTDGWTAGNYAVAPDGSLWAGWDVWDGDRDTVGVCDGISRFDGLTWIRYLSGTCVGLGGMDIAPDGSVWLFATHGPKRDGPSSLYVITPAAAAGTE